MMRIHFLSAVVAMVALAGAAVAFEEQKAPAKAVAPSAGGTALSDPGISVPRPDGSTKIRVPGLGVIGEIPKMDFGLELLYGASQPKQPMDEAQGNGVMGRVTLPIKPSR
ncbi:unnamed protein product [Phaeothamnion confervicola]